MPASQLHLPANAAVGRASVPSLWIAPRRLLVLANAVSLSRGLLAAVLAAAYLAGVRGVALAGVAVVMWATDVADGHIARLGHARGARRRLDGQALDPLMDDLGFVAGFLILFDAGLVPLWFVVALLASRTVFCVIRVVGLTHVVDHRLDATFARSLRLTKLNGVALGCGQIVLLLALAGTDAGLSSHTISTAVVAVMALTTSISVVQFVVRTHWRTLARLLQP